MYATPDETESGFFAPAVGALVRFDGV